MHDKRNLKIAMDALASIVNIYDSGRDAEFAIEEAGELAMKTIRRIERLTHSNPHMGAPGGDRNLLPECPCCDTTMEVTVDGFYECPKDGTRIPRDAWNKRLEEWAEGKA